MRLLFALTIIIGLVSAWGCGSSEEPASTPVTTTKTQETTPPVTQETPNTAPTGTESLPENSGGTAIKANELGPQ
jgi:hypothetical protein